MIRSNIFLAGLLVLIAAYAFGGWWFARSIGADEHFTILLYSSAVGTTSFMLLSLFVGWRFVRIAMTERPERPATALWQDLKTHIFAREKLMQALPVFIAFIVFMSVFTSLKGMIPLFKPYVWDATFAAWDHRLHGGIDPWRLLQPALGFPWLTSLLNLVYNLWFPVMFAVLYWQLFDLRRPTLRMRFFWAFFLTWMVNGTILAMYFSSAGPCFYEDVVHDPRYAEQMTYLKDAAAQYPVWAVATQQMLWQSYQNNLTVIGSGISAMPSVHVAMVALFALLSWQYGRKARVFFILFAIMIFIGSVHLAWHYAVDGYLGAFITAVLWFLTGLVFKKKGNAP